MSSTAIIPNSHILDKTWFPLQTTVTINDCPTALPCTVDTGAAVCLISAPVLQHYAPNATRRSFGRYQVNGISSAMANDSVRLSLRFLNCLQGQATWDVEFLVLETTEVKFILGIDALSHHGTVLDLRKGLMFLPDTRTFIHVVARQRTQAIVQPATAQ